MKRERGRPRVPVAPEKVREMHDAGMTYRKIALELGISDRTARTLAKWYPTQPTNFPAPQRGNLEAV